MQVRSLFLASLLAASSLSAQTTYLSAALAGENEVPAVATAARGWGIVRLVEPANTVNVFLHVTGYTGTLTAAHIHQAPAGVNGGVILALAASGVDTFTGIGTLTAAQVTALKTAGCYLNAHTTTNPGGELRGQLVAPTMTKFMALLNGTQETPPNASTATGTGVAFLDEPNNVLMYLVNASGFTATVTAAHIHQGATGVAGGVIHTLNGALATTTFCGLFQMTAAQTATCKANGMYFNIHSTAFPGGEIRGQILASAPADFAGAMDGAQETPPNASTAVGEVSVVLNPNNTATAIVTQSGIAAPTACHIHLGAPGVAGGIVFGLSGGPTVYTGTSGTLTAAQLADARNGLWYGNVHSATFPGGEIRGQCRVAVRPTSYGPSGLASGGRRPYAATDKAPALGDTFALKMFNAPASIPTVAILGLSRDAYLSIPLPLDLNLAAGAAPGNFLLVDLGVLPTFPSGTDAFGCASVSVPVPFSPPLRGAQLFAQFLNIDFAAPGLISTSNGLSLTLQ